MHGPGFSCRVSRGLSRLPYVSLASDQFGLADVLLDQFGLTFLNFLPFQDKSVGRLPRMPYGLPCAHTFLMFSAKPE